MEGSGCTCACAAISQSLLDWYRCGLRHDLLCEWGGLDQWTCGVPVESVTCVEKWQKDLTVTRI